MKVNKNSYLRGLKNANYNIKIGRLSKRKTAKLHDETDKAQFEALYIAGNNNLTPSERARKKAIHNYWRGQAMAYGYHSKTGKLLRGD